jgi:hypothetical protein
VRVAALVAALVAARVAVLVLAGRSHANELDEQT